MQTIARARSIGWACMLALFTALITAAAAQARPAQSAPADKRTIAQLVGRESPRHTAFVARAKTNPATFTDPVGDSGTAPDITSVVVSNDPNGQITFHVNVAKLVVPSNATIMVAIDSDQNPSTGHSGTDYLLVGDLSTGSVGLLGWDGSNFVESPSTTLTRSNDSTGVSLSVNSSELGKTSGFNFWVGSVDGANTSGNIDLAPDQGTWNYQLAAAATQVELTLRAFLAPKTVRAGKTLAAVMLSTRSDTGKLVGSEAQVECHATVAGKPLRLVRSGFLTVGADSGAACSWQVPRKSRGRTIQGSMTITFQGASVTHRFITKIT